MFKFVRELTRQNVDIKIQEYLQSLEELQLQASGLHLIAQIKRAALGQGPYPNVTLFEAANRIGTDLVILNGIRWMLVTNVFPFESYTVEYGNEHQSGFDIRAELSGKRLIGEAFNVAPSFYQSKKSGALKKLMSAKADFKILVFNQDAVSDGYRPSPQGGELYVAVNWSSGGATISPALLSGPST